MKESLARSSVPLYNLVCTPLVWRRLLRGIADFTVAKVDNKLCKLFQPSTVVVGNIIHNNEL